MSETYPSKTTLRSYTDSSVGWDDDPVVRAWRGFAPLDGNRSVDACVVGLGASGLAAIEAFIAQGASVIGIDAGASPGEQQGAMEVSYWPDQPCLYTKPSNSGASPTPCSAA